jgi:transmembrane sensor
MNKSNLKTRSQAAKWFMRMQGVADDHPARSQFEAWMMQNPTHAHEYAAIASAWHDFDSTQQLQSLAQAITLKNTQHKMNVVNKAASIMLMIVVSFLGYVGWTEWQAQPLMQIALSSNIAEIKKQELPDGSKVTLNAKSAIDITYYRNKRVVTLKRGEAIFEVTKDANRPFVVANDIARVTVLGTRFLVNHVDHRVFVAVDHGRVKVEATNASDANAFMPMILTNGQMAEVNPNAAPVRLKRNAADAFGFAQGKLMFDEATLSEVAETLSRYRAEPVVAISKAGKQPHITAVMNIVDTEIFIKLLPHIAAVEVKHSQNQTQLMSKTSKHGNKFKALHVGV